MARCEPTPQLSAAQAAKSGSSSQARAAVDLGDGERAARAWLDDPDFAPWAALSFGAAPAGAALVAAGRGVARRARRGRGRVA